VIRPLLCAFAALALVGLSAPAQAVDDDLGSPGFCTDEHGVTVVVDFQGLGGDPIVRCAPGSQPRNGLEALKAAGFQVDGVQRWGEAFICRIEDRPSAAEELPLAGAEGYREACIDTPPSTGHWGYFHAENDGEWVYSGAGGKNRTVVNGGFEGWSFALNAHHGQGPPPGMEPVRTPPIGEQQTFSGGEALPDVAAARGEGSSPWPAIGGVSVAAGLGGVALLASRRRRGHDTR
jgi:hypothetical protein